MGVGENNPHYFSHGSTGKSPLFGSRQAEGPFLTEGGRRKPLNKGAAAPSPLKPPSTALPAHPKLVVYLQVDSGSWQPWWGFQGMWNVLPLQFCSGFPWPNGDLNTCFSSPSPTLPTPQVPHWLSPSKRQSSGQLQNIMV